MDIFAHGLWTYAVYRGINKKLAEVNRKPLKAWFAAFWGIFPDLFAFAPTFVWAVWGLLFGGLTLADLPRAHELEPPAQNAFWAWNLPHNLYNISHSIIVFAAVFLAVWLLAKKPWRRVSITPAAGKARRFPWELGGWLLHILIDIPTHSYLFYPTPIFWPFSGWKFGGVAWSTPWFMLLNYSALVVAYIFIFQHRKKSSA